MRGRRKLQALRLQMPVFVLQARFGAVDGKILSRRKKIRGESIRVKDKCTMQLVGEKLFKISIVYPDAIVYW